MLYIPLSVTPDCWISAQSLKLSGSPLGTLEISGKKTTKNKHAGIYLQMATLWVLHTNANPICEFSLLYVTLWLELQCLRCMYIVCLRFKLQAALGDIYLVK